LQSSCSIRGPMEALESGKNTYSSGRQGTRAWKRTSASDKSPEFSRSLEKSHSWPQNVAWTCSGQESLKKISDYPDSGPGSLQPSSQRTSLDCEKANTRFSQQSSGGLGIHQSDRISMSCCEVCSLVLCIRHFWGDSNSILGNDWRA